MKKARFLYRLLTTFIQRHYKIIFAAFFFGIIFFLVAPKFFFLIPRISKTKVIGLVGRYEINDIPIMLQNKISQGLTRIDNQGNVLPSLASDWLIEDNGKVYTFTLGDHYWQDKSKITVSDINYNFNDVKTEILNPSKIKFTLIEPFSAFPSIVSRPIFKKGLIGTGDYKVKNIIKTGKFIESLSLVLTSEPYSTQIYRFYPTEDSAKTAFKLGEIDKIEGVSNSSGFENWKKIKIVPTVLPNQYVGLFLNTNKTPFSDKSFRQALNYALVKNYGDKKAYGPFNPNSWVYNNDVKTYDYDLENAKKLLTKSLGEINKQSIRIKISTISSLLPEADILKQSWEKIGLKVEIGALNSLDDDFDTLLAIQEIPQDPDQYNLWHSTQETNITHFKNPRIDKLLEDGRKTTDKQTRLSLYLDFQRYLVEELPVIFLYHPTVYDIFRN